MPYNAYQNYLESQVLSASSVQLVTILYRAGIDALNAARHHLATGDIRARGDSTTRALLILGELTQSVDREKGGAVAERLLALYDYILRRVQEGNFQGDDAAYGEVIGLLNTLLEGWRAVESTLEPPKSAVELDETRSLASLECSF